MATAATGDAAPLVQVRTLTGAAAALDAPAGATVAGLCQQLAERLPAAGKCRLFHRVCGKRRGVSTAVRALAPVPARLPV